MFRWGKLNSTFCLFKFYAGAYTWSEHLGLLRAFPTEGNSELLEAAFSRHFMGLLGILFFTVTFVLLGWWWFWSLDLWSSHIFWACRQGVSVKGSATWLSCKCLNLCLDTSIIVVLVDQSFLFLNRVECSDNFIDILSLQGIKISPFSVFLSW